MSAIYSGSVTDKRDALVTVALCRNGIEGIGSAAIYHDRIETWRYGVMIGKARSIDDALRQAINAENRELKRRK